MRGKASRAWLFAAVLACLVAGTDAIVSSVSQRIYARGGDARRFDRFGFKAGGGLGRPELTNQRFNPPRGRFSHRWFTIDQIRTFRFEPGGPFEPPGV